MTTLTYTSLFLATLALLRPDKLGLAVALGGVTSAGSALYLGGVALPTFYAVSIGIAALVLARFAQPANGNAPLPPGVGLLLVALAYATIVTLVAPFLFRGLQTVTSSKAILQPGILTSSNVAQIGYLFLGICVMFAIASSKSVSSDLIGIVVGLGVLLSAWRYLSDLSGLFFPAGYFDNSPTSIFIETAPGGSSRFRGIYSEPAGLAATTIIMLTYGFSRIPQVQGLHRTALIALTIVAVYLGIISTSATFILAGLVLLGLAGIRFLVSFTLGRTRLSTRFVFLSTLLVLSSVLWLGPSLTFVRTAIEQKIAGSSFTDRSNSDAGSYDVFFQSWGLGVGLGSGRASSLLPTTLSTIGLLGTLMVTVVIVQLVLRTTHIKQARSVIWSLVGLMVVKLIAGPDLSDSSGVLWISLGLLAGAAQTPDRPDLFGGKSPPVSAAGDFK